MSPLVRLVGDTDSSGTNNTVLQEPQAECYEDGPSTPELCPVHNLDTSEDGIEERDSLTRFNVVPEVFDYNTGERVNISAEPVDFLLRSREEPQEYLRDARIELLDKLPLMHPLWDRMKVDGSLKAKESSSASNDSMQEDVSDEEAALKEALRDADWWDEEDDDAEDNFSEDESDEHEDEAAEDTVIEETPVENTAAESAGSRSLRNASSESSEEE